MAQLTQLTDFLTANTNLDLARLLISLAEGCKQIGRFVNNAGISGITGSTGSTNVQGEVVQKLDDLSNKILMDYLRASETCAGYLSEENEGITTLHPQGQYTIAVDPLDGSSNIDVVAPIGTIFCIHQRLSETGNVTEADFLQEGYKAKAAGYVVYGSSTVLVLSLGKGVYGFTLSTDDQQFYLSHSQIQTPESGKIYSVNQGNATKWNEKVRQYMDWCTASDKATSRPYALRYIGSMVGDLHRNLLKGGIFLYPANQGETKGKLRLLYECIPMAYIVEQAGGAATNGYQRVLDIRPTELHERSAIFIGSRQMVAKALELLQP